MDYVAHYWEHGWVVVPGVFSRAQVQRVADIADQVGRSELADGPVTPMSADMSSDGQFAPRKIDWAFPKHPEFRSLVLNPDLQELIKGIIGQPGYLEGYSRTLFVMSNLPRTAACLHEEWPVSRKDVVTTPNP